MEPNKQELNPKKQLSFFSFFSFSASIIMTMLLFSTFASSGMNAIFFLVIGAIFWFIPIGFVSATLGSIKTWESGGIFVWVKNSLGQRFGFVATFFQWFQTTIVYTILFYFLTAGISYVFNTNIFDNQLYQFLLITALFTVMTSIQLFGIKFIAFLSKLSLFLGVLIPSLILIVLSFSFTFASGIHEIPSTLNWNIFPSDNITTIVIFSSFILGYTGIEESASNISSLKNAKKNYPIIIILVIILIISFDILASMSISLILPPEQITFSSAIFDTFNRIFLVWFGSDYLWIAKIISVLIIFGILGQISSIISGPSKAMVNSLNYFNAPKFLLKKNKKNANYVFLIIQAFFMIMWLSIITFSSKDANIAFTTCISISSVIYLLAYLLLIIGYLKVAWLKQELEHSFFLKNKFAKTIMGSLGLLTTIFVIVIVFFNPGGISNESYIIYVSILSSSIFFIIGIAFLIYELLLRFNNKIKH